MIQCVLATSLSQTLWSSKVFIWKCCKTRIPHPSQAIESPGQLKKLWHLSWSGALHTICSSPGLFSSPGSTLWFRKASGGGRSKGSMACQRHFSPVLSRLGTLCLGFPSGRAQNSFSRTASALFTTLVRTGDTLDVLQLKWVHLEL